VQVGRNDNVLLLRRLHHYVTEIPSVRWFRTVRILRSCGVQDCLHVKISTAYPKQVHRRPSVRFSNKQEDLVYLLRREQGVSECIEWLGAMAILGVYRIAALTGFRGPAVMARCLAHACIATTGDYVI